MLLHKNNRGQSILEYALLLGIIIAGVLIMQSFVKRGFQGNLKESADKMGEQFSASGTTVHQKRALNEDQRIVEEVATTTDTEKGIAAFTDDSLKGTVNKGVYSYSERTGGEATSEVRTKTEAASQEKFKISDHPATAVEDFTSDAIKF